MDDRVHDLAALLSSRSIKDRLESFEKLQNTLQLGARDTLVNVLNRKITGRSPADQFETITLAQGRSAGRSFLQTAFAAFDEDGDVVDRGELLGQFLQEKGKALKIEEVGEALRQVLRQEGAIVVEWCALTALVELGDRADSVLEQLIQTSEVLRQRTGSAAAETRDAVIEAGEDFAQDFTVFTVVALGDSEIAWEALRAISKFVGNSKAAGAATRALDGLWLNQPPRRPAIYALGAIADPSTRPILERIANDKNDRFVVDARLSLDLFGKAGFDQIREKARTLPRGYAAEQQSPGCFIATAVYGDADHPDVRLLRKFRDEVLLSSVFGRATVHLYYFVSPTMVAFIRTNVIKSLIHLAILRPAILVARRKLRR